MFHVKQWKVRYNMTKEQIYLRGCIFAISNLQQKGSGAFASSDECGRTQVYHGVRLLIIY